MPFLPISSWWLLRLLLLPYLFFVFLQLLRLPFEPKSSFSYQSSSFSSHIFLYFSRFFFLGLNISLLLDFFMFDRFNLFLVLLLFESDFLSLSAFRCNQGLMELAASSSTTMVMGLSCSSSLDFLCCSSTRYSLDCIYFFIISSSQDLSLAWSWTFLMLFIMSKTSSQDCIIRIHLVTCHANTILFGLFLLNIQKFYHNSSSPFASTLA